MRCCFTPATVGGSESARHSCSSRSAARPSRPPALLAWWSALVLRPNWGSRLTPTCCGTPADSPWQTKGTISAPCRPIAAIRTFSTWCATPSGTYRSASRAIGTACHSATFGPVHIQEHGVDSPIWPASTPGVFRIRLRAEISAYRRGSQYRPWGTSECSQGFVRVPHQLSDGAAQLDCLSAKSTVPPHAIRFTAWRARREAAVDSAAAVRHCW
jgi:hypothetical protein